MLCAFITTDHTGFAAVWTGPCVFTTASSAARSTGSVSMVRHFPKASAVRQTSVEQGLSYFLIAGTKYFIPPVTEERFSSAHSVQRFQFIVS